MNRLSTFRFVCVAISLLIIGSQQLMAQVSVTAQIRPRTEFRHGFKKLMADDDKPAIFTEQRSRITLNYSDPVNQQFQLRFSLQDVRIWGETGQINKSDGLSSVHEAYGIYNFNKKFAIKLGRQELVYDDHRILGSLGWAAQARSHDAVVFIYKGGSEKSPFTMHIGGTWNQDALIPEPAKLQSGTGNVYNNPKASTADLDLGFTLPQPKTMQYLWLTNKIGKLNYSAILLNTGMQADVDKVTFMQTIGLNPSIKVSDKLKLAGSVYYQTGKTTADADISAVLASVQATLKAGKTPLTIGVDYLSGNDTNDDTYTSFNPLFGTHHKFYGLMDYFYVGNPHGDVGLTDIFFKTKFKLSEKSALVAHLHQFLANQDVPTADGTGTMGASMGTEADFVFVHKASKSVNLKVGYSQLFGTETMETIKGGSRSNLNAWGWVMLDIKPQLVFGKKE